MSLSEFERAEEFSKFLADLPREAEADLARDHVATAYFGARERGWEQEELTVGSLQKLANGGPGLVVDYLRGLSYVSPQKRAPVSAAVVLPSGPLPECITCGQPYRRGFTPQVCTECGEDLRLRVGPDNTFVKYGSPEDQQERWHLLGQIRDLHLDPEMASALMDELINEQRRKYE